MFSDKKNKNSGGVIGNQQNRITEGTAITGDFTAQSGLRVDGIIEGNVKSPSKVVIGPKGVIKGTLSCENADIEGKFYGKIHISDVLTLKSIALVDGDVVAGKLAVEPGATFNATCVMKGTVKPINASPEKDIKSQNHLFERSERSEKNKEQAL